MAYSNDEKSTGLDVVTSLAEDDIIVSGDTSDSGNLKGSTWAVFKGLIKTYIESLTSYFNVSTDTLDDITDGSTYVKSQNDYTDAEQAKLAGIEEGADMLKSVYDTNDVGSVDASMAVVGYVRKGSAGTILKGQPVYLSGYNPSDFIEVELADASSSATMPVLGIATEDITNATLGKIICLGKLTAFDTSSFSVGDILYVSTTAGALTNVRPTGAADNIQPIGEVIRSHATLGAMKVSCSVEVEGLPNLASGYFWQGDGSNFPTATDFDTAVGASALVASAIHDDVASEISAITEKATPVSADMVVIEDSADSNNKKMVQVGNLPGGDGDGDVDGGTADSIYTASQVVDGGTA